MMKVSLAVGREETVLRGSQGAEIQVASVGDGITEAEYGRVRGACCGE